MKATELRIGNIVRCNDDGTIFKIDEITAMGLTVTVLGGGETTWIEFDQFEPITLTVKWLTDFGFMKVDDHFENEDCWIYILPDCFELEFITKAGRFNLFKPYQYVHQLQNLYFALTGEELTLTL